MPENTYVNRNDSRVFVFVRDDSGKVRRRTIGYAQSDTTMMPNDAFRHLFPDLWIEQLGSSRKEAERSVGLYAFCLSTAERNGLYAVLRETLGVETANFCMDQAMYHLAGHCDKMPFDEWKKRQVCFAAGSKELFPSGAEDRFLQGWIQRCRAAGMDSVWIYAGIGQQTCAALAADKGEMPVAMTWTEPGETELETALRVAGTLCRENIGVKGFYLKQGNTPLCSLGMLTEQEGPFQLRLAEHEKMHLEAVDRFGNEIRWNPSCLLSKNAVFGKRIDLAEENGIEHWLLFDGREAMRHRLEQIRELYVCAGQQDEKAVAQEEWERSADEAGFYSVVVRGMPAYEEEKQEKLLFLKAGCEMAEHPLLALLVSILYGALQEAAREAGVDDDAVCELEALNLRLLQEDQYVFEEENNTAGLRILEKVGILRTHLEQIAAEESRGREAGGIRAIPDIRTGQPYPKQRRGRKKRAERMESAARAQTGGAHERGRPKGKKDTYPRKRRTKREIAVQLERMLEKNL